MYLLYSADARSGKGPLLLSTFHLPSDWPADPSSVCVLGGVEFPLGTNAHFLSNFEGVEHENPLKNA